MVLLFCVIFFSSLLFFFFFWSFIDSSKWQKKSFTKLTLYFHQRCNTSLTCHWIHVCEVCGCRGKIQVRTWPHPSLTFFSFFFGGSVISRQHQRFKQSAAAGFNVLSKMKVRSMRAQWNYGSARAKPAAWWVKLLLTDVLPLMQKITMAVWEKLIKLEVIFENCNTILPCRWRH